MAAYLTAAEFKTLTLAPASYVDAEEAAEAGWILARLTHWSDRIDAQLRKRYAVPFVTPFPPILTGWLEALVTFELYLKRGVDATDAQIQEMRARFDATKAEVLQAADAEGGLFELPLKATDPTGAVTKGAPQAYSEQSPYTWTQAQIDAAGAEGIARRGS